MATDEDGTVEGERPVTPDAPGPPEPAASAGRPDSAPATGSDPTPGRIRRQEPGVTTPRPPTAGETRAREKARHRQAEEERLAAEAAARDEAKRRTRRRALIGGVAVVGIVGLVALGYTVLADDEVDATCIDPDTEVVVDDSYCATGTPNGSGMFLYAGSTYRYYYGGTAGPVGTKVTGGTVVTPKGATIKTKSATVQRGGFGSKSTGSGGSSGS